MESDGVVGCYLSVIGRQLRYLTYIGDGTQNIFKMSLMQILALVLLSKKAECVGHVQKRVGTAT